MHRVLRCRHSWQLLVPFRMRFAGRSSDMARVATEDQNASEQKLGNSAAAALSDGGRFKIRHSCVACYPALPGLFTYTLSLWTYSSSFRHRRCPRAGESLGRRLVPQMLSLAGSLMLEPSCISTVLMPFFAIVGGQNATDSFLGFVRNGSVLSPSVRTDAPFPFRPCI